MRIKALDSRVRGQAKIQIGTFQILRYAILPLNFKNQLMEPKVYL